MTRRTCPGCGARWTLHLNRGAKHQPWHDDPRCIDCRSASVDVVPEPTTPEPTTPDMYATLTQLLTPSPAASPPTFQEPGVGRGYGTYPAVRDCPRCGAEWTLLVDRPARQSRRNATCGPCRTQAMHRANELDLPVGDPPGEWYADGLCAQTDPEIFYPDKGGSTREAKAICQRCPVIEPCRDWAVSTGQRFGVWGGLSERERRALAIERAAS